MNIFSITKPASYPKVGAYEVTLQIISSKIGIDEGSKMAVWTS